MREEVCEEQRSRGVDELTQFESSSCLHNSVSECGNRAFAKNGDPVSIELPLETRKGVIATQAGGGAIAGAGVLGALLFRRSRAKKRSAGDVNAKVVEIGSV